MNKGIKKAIVCTLLLGMAQFGLATTATIEASPRGDKQQQRNNWQQRNNRHFQENQRHDREMQRRGNEDDRDWNDRQQRENQLHECNGRDIDKY